MLTALVRGLRQLGDPSSRRYLLLGLLLAVAVFALLWTGVGWLLVATRLSSIGWLETVFDLLGGAATLVVTWLLFPGVLSAVLALFLEGVVAAAERRHHQDLPPAPGLPFLTSLGASLRLLLSTVLLNLLLLPALLVPVLFPILYLLANGLLLGREYFELVALRRLAPPAAKALRRRRWLALLVVGTGIAAGLALPLVNLLVPLVAAAAMTHLVVDWQRS